MFYQFKPVDVIALVVLSGSLLLIGLGINHVVSGVVIAIISFYFGYHTDGVKKKE